MTSVTFDPSAKFFVKFIVIARQLLNPVGKFAEPPTRSIRWRRAVVIWPALALVGCAQNAPLSRPIIAEPTTKLSFSALRSYTTTKGVLVTGHVYRRSPLIGPLWGHVHIIAAFKSGPPVAIDTRWSGSLSKRGHRMALFSATIPTASPESLASISVTYRPNRDQPDGQ